MKNAIISAAQIADKYGLLSQNSALSAEIKDLENPNFKVAVVGKFQVGKSTLINRVFLRDNAILVEGDGLCTTSVTTEITYGPTEKLEVYNWDSADKNGDHVADVITNPTTEQLKDITVGADRAALAAKVSRVKFYTTNERLEKYTILDTPGVDDPDKEILLNTTYRVIPTCDLAIVVAEPRMLDTAILDLLRKRLFADGVSKMMLMLSVKPENHLSADTRKDILENVKAQLADIGREDIPVEMFSFDGEDVEDMLTTPQQIALKISAFLNANAMPGREARVKAHLFSFLQEQLLNVAAKIKGSKQTDEEREELKRKIAKQLDEIHNKCDELRDELSGDLAQLQQKYASQIKTTVGKTFLDYGNSLDKVPSLGALQKKLKQADSELKLLLADSLNPVMSNLERDIKRLLSSKEEGTTKNIYLAWNEFLDKEIGVEGGFLSKVPSIVFDGVNVVLLNLLLPGGWLLAGLSHLLIGKTGLDKFLNLSTIAKNFLTSKVKDSLEEAKEQVVQEIMDNVKRELSRIATMISENTEKQYEKMADQIRSGLNNQTQDDHAKSMEPMVNDLKDAMNSLS